MTLLIGPGGCGFSFLTWSLIYLRGSDSYQKLNGDLVPVPPCPLDALGTAHKFDRDHFVVYSNGSNSLEILDYSESTVVYVIPYNQQQADQLAKTPHRKIFFCGSGNEKQIIVRILTKLKTKSSMVKALAERWSLDEYGPVLLKHAKRMIPQVPGNLENAVTIDYTTMFRSLDSQIPDVARWCGCTLNQDRLTAWKQIYMQWSADTEQSIDLHLQHLDRPIDLLLEKEISKFLYRWWKGQ